MSYSIVAHDQDTGELGVAVQSHGFSVGSIVTWATPGLGAVAHEPPPRSARRRRGEGGDLRGRQSAAILVVPADGERWRTVVSLRVEDHPDPPTELHRLVILHDAHAVANEADELLNSSRHEEAARLYVEASERTPGNHELLFWAGLGTAQAGDVVDAGVEQVRAAIALQPTWRELLRRLPPEVAPSAAAVLARVGDG